MKTYTFTLTIRTPENLAHCIDKLLERISGVAYLICSIGGHNPDVTITYDKLESDDGIHRT